MPPSVPRPAPVPDYSPRPAPQPSAERKPAPSVSGSTAQPERSTNSYTRSNSSAASIQFANGFVLQCKVLAASRDGIQVVDSSGKTYKFLSALLSRATLEALGIDP